MDGMVLHSAQILLAVIVAQCLLLESAISTSADLVTYIQIYTVNRHTHMVQSNITVGPPLSEQLCASSIQDLFR